ncbi:hypothetical protein IE4872_CH01839 [Rhizobium gallicum]|uniref:Uncharacterized protein n=1 Tax=Rhizobium gallicum TaxID=56730 RepID=A0A1L5NHU7_9HYPH|nr:hypothetical protein IE4872_CH01839 [Rhizobium gallicum]
MPRSSIAINRNHEICTTSIRCIGMPFQSRGGPHPYLASCVPLKRRAGNCRVEVKYMTIAGAPFGGFFPQLGLSARMPRLIGARGFGMSGYQSRSLREEGCKAAPAEHVRKHRPSTAARPPPECQVLRISLRTRRAGLVSARRLAVHA